MNKVENRLKVALSNLKEQLVRGTKPVKINGKTTGNSQPLSEKDISRINKEIEILNKKLKN